MKKLILALSILALTGCQSTSFKGHTFTGYDIPAFFGSGQKGHYYQIKNDY